MHTYNITDDELKKHDSILYRKSYVLYIFAELSVYRYIPASRHIFSGLFPVISYSELYSNMSHNHPVAVLYCTVYCTVPIQVPIL